LYSFLGAARSAFAAARQALLLASCSALVGFLSQSSTALAASSLTTVVVVMLSPEYGAMAYAGGYARFERQNIGRSGGKRKGGGGRGRPGL